MVKKYFVFWIILFLVNAGVTFYAFNQIPHNLAFDEILLAKLALMLGKQPYTLFTSYADGHATPYFYLLLGLFKLFGVNNFALRITSALAGFLGVFVFYEIMKKVFSNKYIGQMPLSFIMSILFACVRWRINFVRFSFEMPYLLLLELLSTYFLFQFQEQKKARYGITAGVFAALAFNSYQPGLIFFLVPLGYLLFTRASFKNIVTFLLPFSIIAVPLGVFLLVNPTGAGRINQLSYLTKPRLSIQTKMLYLGQNIEKTGLMFIYKGDANGRHNFPYKAALNPIFAGLFLIGIIFACIKITDKYAWYFVWYFVISLVPALLTLPSENPHMLRTFTSIPSVIFFMGLALTLTLEKKIVQTKAIIVLILGVLALGCVYELRTYFYYQARVARNSFEVNCPLEKVVYTNTTYIGNLMKSCKAEKNLF